jgi:O-antigen/teichoic acid export membrane protein
LKRKFVTNLGFLIVLNVIVKPAYVFGIERVVQNTVGAEVYGNFFSLFSLALIFQIFLDLGIENFIRKEIARHPDLVSHYLSNIALLKILLAIPYAIICILIAIPMKLDRHEVIMLLFILLNQFMASFILYFRANLGGLQLFKTEGIVSVMDRALMILIVGFLILNPISSKKFDIIWFVKAQTISYSIVLLVSFIIILRKSRPLKFHINLSKLVPVIQQLKPYALLVLLMAIYYRADSIFLRVLLPDGEKQAGIYVHAFRILDFMSNYALLFPILLLPIFSKILHAKGRIEELLRLSVILLIVPSLAAIVPAVFYRVELFSLLYKEHIETSSNVFAILTFSYFGMCISYTFGALLTANGNLRQLNQMAFTAVIISVLLNLLLIPRIEVLGAALANAISQFFTIVIHIVLAVRIFNLKTNFPLLLRLTGYFLLLLLSGFIIHSTGIPWVYGYIAIFIVGIVAALLFNLISLRSILTLLKQRDLA